jgi:hypothetical protein
MTKHPPPAPEDEAGYPQRVIVLVTAALRVASLVLGLLHVVAMTGGPQRVAAILWTALAGESILVFGRAGRSLNRRPDCNPFDRVTVFVETGAALVGLAVLATVVARGARIGAGFWMEPYSVVTVLILAAADGSLLPGLIGALILASGYLAATAWRISMSAVGRGTLATIVTNALSYPAFWVVGVLGFRLHQDVSDQVLALRMRVTAAAAERARLVASIRGHRIAHDIPKAFLRELRRARLSPETLRLWAVSFRQDLLQALGRDPRQSIALRAELEAVTRTFRNTMQLTMRLDGLPKGHLPVPALVLAEAVRECVNNASYHRSGSPVWVSAGLVNGVLEIEVGNGGPGCDPRRAEAIWASKCNSIHQVMVAGGSYAVESTPTSDGTLVRLCFPMTVVQPGGGSAPGEGRGSTAT